MKTAAAFLLLLLTACAQPHAHVEVSSTVVAAIEQCEPLGELIYYPTTDQYVCEQR